MNGTPVCIYTGVGSHYALRVAHSQQQILPALPCVYHPVYVDCVILYAEHLGYVDDPVYVDYFVMYQNLEVYNSDLLWNHTW